MRDGALGRRAHGKTTLPVIHEAGNLKHNFNKGPGKKFTVGDKVLLDWKHPDSEGETHSLEDQEAFKRRVGDVVKIGPKQMVWVNWGDVPAFDVIMMSPVILFEAGVGFSYAQNDLKKIPFKKPKSATKTGRWKGGAKKPKSATKTGEKCGEKCKCKSGGKCCCGPKCKCKNCPCKK